jgi:glutamate-ammonia-ligase adenylyltransferase
VADQQALSGQLMADDPGMAPARLSGLLAARAGEALGRYRQAGGSTAHLDAKELARVFACSDFVASCAERDPAMLESLAVSGELDRPRRDREMDDAAAALVGLHEDEAGFMAGLRALRRRELVRIAWRDLTGRARLAETLLELSALADAAIRCARSFATRSLAGRFGVPRAPGGGELELVVLGMGKLGGRELNFSSDIDLVFLYPEGGDTDGRKSIANEEYFTRLGQMLIRLLDAPTVDGFVFRVDMRLRPFGDSGPLVASFGAVEDYLQQHGRDWERYAYVKARAITGADHYATLYDDVIRPFVYRRYLDFGVFESLREMKEMIAREVVRRELQENVKLGPGGIREIEFVAQSLQLIRGGSDPRLQSPSLLAVLPRLEGAKLLGHAAVRELGDCYEFLRRVENRLQMFEDGQTHTLPADDAGRARLAMSMSFDGWPAFSAAFDAVRDRVSTHFRDVVFGPEGAPGAPATADLGALWVLEPDLKRVAEDVARLDLADPEAIAGELLVLMESSYYKRLDEHGRKRLATLLPRVLRSIAAKPAADEGEGGSPAAEQTVLLQRIRRIVESIGGRTAYLSLLNENPQALERLVEVCGHGDFLARQVAAFPILLDELIDARVFVELPDREQFARELDARLEQAGGDLERQIDALRHFRRAARFRVALLDLTGRMPLMVVSDRLTDVAELILDRAMRLAWEQLVAIHGEPSCGDAGSLRTAGLAAIGYGKLGGWELGYASDLDLVFLHDSGGNVQQTTGPKVVDNAVFFNRFGQRLVHLLTVHTAAGRLYEVDMRLRPSGKGGLAVTHLPTFEEYQKCEAWTWEHQALLHSRSVAGSPAIREEFERIRRDVLMNHVRRDTLREDVRSMRERMRAELGHAGEGQFDLKQDPGGIADIEFLAQYWVLRWVLERPPLCAFSDTIRQLESLGSAALVDHRVIDQLVDAYRRLRQVAHRLSLEEQPPVVPAAPFADQRQAVTRIWQDVMLAGREPSPL